MISTIERNPTDKNEDRKYDLYINGKKLCKADGLMEATLSTEKMFHRLGTSVFSDLADKVDLILRWKFDSPEFLSSIFVEHNSVVYYVKASLLDWKKPFSIVEFSAEVVACSRSKRIRALTTKVYEDEEHAIEFTFKVKGNPRIIEEVERSWEIVRQICECATQNLHSRIGANSLTAVFEFPEGVRVPCEQYLLYFVSFLKDCGVQADTSLSHEAGRVLFSVTPQNPDEGLEKLRTALEIYLKLPSSMFEEDRETVRDLAVQRLIANVYHLKAQLSLAQATIQSQQLTISESLFNRQVVRTSLIEANAEVATLKKKEEEILGGLVSVTPLEMKGFKINLPQLYRWLRDFLAE